MAYQNNIRFTGPLIRLPGALFAAISAQSSYHDEKLRIEAVIRISLAMLQEIFVLKKNKIVQNFVCDNGGFLL